MRFLLILTFLLMLVNCKPREVSLERNESLRSRFEERLSWNNMESQLFHDLYNNKDFKHLSDKEAHKFALCVSTKYTDALRGVIRYTHQLDELTNNFKEKLYKDVYVMCVKIIFMYKFKK